MDMNDDNDEGLRRRLAKRDRDEDDNDAGVPDTASKQRCVQVSYPPNVSASDDTRASNGSSVTSSGTNGDGDDEQEQEHENYHEHDHEQEDEAHIAKAKHAIALVLERRAEGEGDPKLRRQQKGQQQEHEEQHQEHQHRDRGTHASHPPQHTQEQHQQLQQQPQQALPHPPATTRQFLVPSNNPMEQWKRLLDRRPDIADHQATSDWLRSVLHVSGLWKRTAADIKEEEEDEEDDKPPSRPSPSPQSSDN